MGVPSQQWNGQLVPLLNTTIKGTIWYQGESNHGQNELCVPVRTVIRPSRQEVPTQHQSLYYPFLIDQIFVLARRYTCRYEQLMTEWRNQWHIGTGGATDPNMPMGFVQIG